MQTEEKLKKYYVDFALSGKAMVTVFWDVIYGILVID